MNENEFKKYICHQKHKNEQENTKDEVKKQIYSLSESLTEENKNIFSNLRNLKEAVLAYSYTN